MKAQKVFKTNDDTILIVSVSTDGCNNRSYVSVTADEIQPILKTELLEQEREYLKSEGIPTSRLTQKELINSADCSLYNEEISINKQKYLYRSVSCGCLHETIKELTNEFDSSIALHLSSHTSDIKKCEDLILSIEKQNIDIDFEVEKLTREIFNIDK